MPKVLPTDRRPVRQLKERFRLIFKFLEHISELHWIFTLGNVFSEFDLLGFQGPSGPTRFSTKGGAKCLADGQGGPEKMKLLSDLISWDSRAHRDQRGFEHKVVRKALPTEVGPRIASWIEVLACGLIRRHLKKKTPNRWAQLISIP